MRLKAEAMHFQNPKKYLWFLTPFCNLKRYFGSLTISIWAILRDFGVFSKVLDLVNRCWLNHITNVFRKTVYLLTFKMPCRPSSCDVLSRKYYFLKLGNFSSFLLFLAILTSNCMFCCKKEVKITKNTKNHLTLKNNIFVIRHRMRTVDTAF